VTPRFRRWIVVVALVVLIGAAIVGSVVPR
jgi:hypothetical protein